VDRTATPDSFVPDPAGGTWFLHGAKVPFSAFCPCTEGEDGTEYTAVGRAPATFGTRSFMWEFLDGISLVVNFNSNEHADPTAFDHILADLHEIAAQGL
jgi:hypothetical protein